MKSLGRKQKDVYAVDTVDSEKDKMIYPSMDLYDMKELDSYKVGDTIEIKMKGRIKRLSIDSKKMEHCIEFTDGEIVNEEK